MRDLRGSITMDGGPGSGPHKGTGEKDNQGRNLKAVKEHQDLLARQHEEGVRRSHEEFEKSLEHAPLPTWQTVKGVKVLRSGVAQHVAVPRNGKESSAKFDIIHIGRGEHVTTLGKNEVHGWLRRAALAEKDK